MPLAIPSDEMSWAWRLLVAPFGAERQAEAVICCPARALVVDC